MERFPLFDHDIGAKEALGVLVERRAPGVVLQIPHVKRLIAWSDIAAAARKHDESLVQLPGLNLERVALAETLPRSTFVGLNVMEIPGYITMASRFSIVGAKVCPNLPPPPYPCTCGGRCPY